MFKHNIRLIIIITAKMITELKLTTFHPIKIWNIYITKHRIARNKEMVSVFFNENSGYAYVVFVFYNHPFGGLFDR